MFDRLARGRVTAGGVNYPVPGGMLETAENLRREYTISRQEQDELSLRSHQRAVAAQQKGRFNEEIVPGHGRTGARATPSSTPTSTRGPTPRSSRWPRCARCMLREDPEATVTAGNCERAERRCRRSASSPTPRGPPSSGLRPLARFARGPSPGSSPNTMGIGPVPATAKALERAGPVAGRHRPDRAQRGLRRPGAGGAPGSGSSPTRTSTGSTCTARASRSVTRSAPPAAASWPPCSARWTAGAPPSGSRRCASAAARGSPPCSRRSADPTGDSAVDRRRPMHVAGDDHLLDLAGPLVRCGRAGRHGRSARPPPRACSRRRRGSARPGRPPGRPSRCRSTWRVDGPTLRSVPSSKARADARGPGCARPGSSVTESAISPWISWKPAIGCPDCLRGSGRTPPTRRPGARPCRRTGRRCGPGRGPGTAWRWPTRCCARPRSPTSAAAGTRTSSR